MTGWVGCWFMSPQRDVTSGAARGTPSAALQSELHPSVGAAPGQAVPSSRNARGPAVAVASKGADSGSEAMNSSILRALRQAQWREAALAFTFCPACAGRRPIVRVARSELGVRCLACRSSAVTMSLISVLRGRVPELADKHVYELSSRGPLFRFLSRHAGRLTCSEYFDDVAPGACRDGVMCQDVQRLTLPTGQFDLCTSTEVFEHVPNDRRAFAEMHRILRPGGMLLFTVPLSAAAKSVERAVVAASGEIEYLLPPEFHGDPFRAGGSVLAFRNYGADIVERLRSQGFSEAEIVRPPDPIPWQYARWVVVARKGEGGRARHA
jgi:SAM-dependent methyltransferase